jgi:hypothetical protein
MTDPIATYSETRFPHKRFFTLFGDTIRVNGKSFNGDFEANIRLTLLNPIPDKQWIRNSGFGAGILLCLVAIFMAFVNQVALSKLIEFSSIAVGIAGILLMAWSCRKVEWVRFKNSSEIVILDLAKSGKQRANFDQFVSRLTDQIRAQKSAGQDNPP